MNQGGLETAEKGMGCVVCWQGRVRGDHSPALDGEGGLVPAHWRYQLAVVLWAGQYIDGGGTGPTSHRDGGTCRRVSIQGRMWHFSAGFLHPNPRVWTRVWTRVLTRPSPGHVPSSHLSQVVSSPTCHGAHLPLGLASHLMQGCGPNHTLRVRAGPRSCRAAWRRWRMPALRPYCSTSR